MKRILFLVQSIVLFCTGFTCAQSGLPDSVAEKFKSKPQDSVYVKELNQLANDYLRNNPQITREIAAHCLDVASKIDFKRGYARSLTILGNSYWYEGVYEYALRYYLMAVREYKVINDSIGLGQTYNNIGEVYKKQEEYDKSLEYLLAATELKKHDSATAGITYYNIGELYLMTGNLHKAKEYLDHSMELGIIENNQRVIAYDNWTLGKIESLLGNNAHAITMFTKAETIWKELGETRSLIQTYQDFSDVYRKLKDYKSAEKYLNLAFHLSSTINVPDLEVANYYRRFQLDSARGQYSNALRDLYLFTQLKDSVYNLSKNEQINRLQLIYETEARERENTELRREKELKDAQLNFQKSLLIAISVSLGIVGILAWMFFRQRKRTLSVNKELKVKNEEIKFQKEAIESQAVALLKLNAELQELNKSLETRISKRTEQLMIQNQRLTEYTFVNAHKLRAPVASILGLINLIAQVTPEERPAILEHLKACGDQLDNIIRVISRDLEAAIVEKKDQPFPD